MLLIMLKKSFNFSFLPFLSIILLLFLVLVRFYFHLVILEILAKINEKHDQVQKWEEYDKNERPKVTEEEKESDGSPSM